VKPADALFLVRQLLRSGIAGPERPDHALRALAILRRWGSTPASGYATSALRQPDRPAIVDEGGTLTFAEVHGRTNALARGLASRGLGPGDGIALLCRNHRHFVEVTVACAKLGADVLYLNTSFAGPQLADVVARERPRALIYDAEFAPLLAGVDAGVDRLVAWPEPGAPTPADTSLDALRAGFDADDLSPPERPGRTVILTSGTTGTPKGAERHHPESLLPAATLLSVIPLRARDRTLIAAPLFHSWGLAHFALGVACGSTLFLRRRFDPEDTLAEAAAHGVSAIAVVPVMIGRIMDLPEEVRARYPLPDLRVVAASGSPIPGALSAAFMDAYGDVLYNLYGSTEVAWATVASPADMRAAPGTAGRPPRGTTIRLYDNADRAVPDGAVGRIFVANGMAFEGYTDGGGKPVIDGLMSTGDIGRIDHEGRLFVEGREDDMIVSGGENVYPGEVEELLCDHPAVADAVVVGVEDEQFGQRLKAFVVRRAGFELGEEEVQAHVRERLARYKVPREVAFLDELPRNATGKVLRRELR